MKTARNLDVSVDTKAGQPAFQSIDSFLANLDPDGLAILKRIEHQNATTRRIAAERRVVKAMRDYDATI